MTSRFYGQISRFFMSIQAFGGCALNSMYGSSTVANVLAEHSRFLLLECTDQIEPGQSKRNSLYIPVLWSKPDAADTHDGALQSTSRVSPSVQMHAAPPFDGGTDTTHVSVLNAGAHVELQGPGTHSAMQSAARKMGRGRCLVFNKS